jgi:hypothetical protein
MPKEPVGKVNFLKRTLSAKSKIGSYFLPSKVLRSLVQCSYSRDIAPTPIAIYLPLYPESGAQSNFEGLTLGAPRSSGEA